MTKSLYPALLFFLVAAPLSAQSEHQASPEALAARVNDVTVTHDWEGLAELIDPDEVRRVHRAFGQLLDLQPEASVLEAFGVSNVTDFHRLRPDEVMTGFFSLAEVRQQLEAIEILGSRVVGIVSEEPDQAHAVIRQTIRVLGRDLSTADIVSMRRRSDGWWLVMGGEMEGLIIGLEAAVGEVMGD